MIMSRYTRRFVAAIALVAFASPVFAQVYPTTSPVYIPTAVKTVAGLAVPGSVGLTTQNLGAVIANVSGTYTGLAATFQGTSDAIGTTSPVWKNIGALPLAGGGKLTAITANGLYRLNASGYTQIRFNVTAVTVSGSNTVSVAFSGTPSTSRVSAAMERQPTYSASVTALATATSATDFVTLTGSASATVRLTHAECAGTAATEGVATVQAVVRSTANTSGTSAAMVAQQHDSLDPAATATALSYTANPTLGTSTAILRSGKMLLPLATTSVTTPTGISWDFGREDSEAVTLRGIAQVFALNGNGATLAATASVNCSLTWTEE